MPRAARIVVLLVAAGVIVNVWLLSSVSAFHPFKCQGEWGKHGADINTGPDHWKGTVNHDVYSGLGGDDTIWGSPLDQAANDAYDTLCGDGTGNPSLYGQDIILGFAGGDKINGEEAGDNIAGGPGQDKIYGDPGNDSIDGNAAADSLWARNGNDEVLGGDGNDYLSGGDLTDECWGGPGSDSFYECETVHPD